MDSHRVWIWIRNIAIGLVIAAFVAVFGQPSGSTPSGAVAEVNGELIPRDVFEFFRDLTASRSREVLPPNLDPAEARKLIDSQTMNNLIYRYIQAQEAEALGLRVSDEELAQELAANPDFQPDGRFDPQIFERSWRRAGFESERSYTEEHRRDLLIRKFRRLISSPVRISDAQVREMLLRERLRVRLRYGLARAREFRDRVEISAEDARRFASEQPERLDNAYQAQLGQYQQPEQVRVRHILLTGEDALAQADAARVRLTQGEDFGALARELSQDAATRQEGGDLGFFPRGRMLAAFEEAAFALGPGGLSQPVETERGAHLILLEERRAGIDKQLEEVSEELARQLLRDERAQAAARAAAEEMLARLGGGGDFDAVAAELGLTSEETVPFGPLDFTIPGIGRVPGLKEAALTLEPERPHADRVFSDGDTFYVISLLERDEPDPGTLDNEMALAREQLESQARGRVLNQWAESRRKRLQQAGKLVQFPLYPAN